MMAMVIVLLTSAAMCSHYGPIVQRDVLAETEIFWFLLEAECYLIAEEVLSDKQEQTPASKSVLAGMLRRRANHWRRRRKSSPKKIQQQQHLQFQMSTCQSCSVCLLAVEEYPNNQMNDRVRSETHILATTYLHHLILSHEGIRVVV